MQFFRSRCKLVYFLLLPAAAISGCAGWGKSLQPPRVFLANIRAQEFSGLEAVFRVDLRVINPNDTELEVKGIECDLRLNGKPFATGIANAAVKLPAYGAAVVPITFYSSVLDMAKSLSTLSKNQVLQYRLAGKLHLSGGFGAPSVLPFRTEGRLAPGDVAPPEK